jgi:hypothetical protein
VNSEVWGVGRVILSWSQDIPIEFWWVNIVEIYKSED